MSAVFVLLWIASTIAMLLFAFKRKWKKATISVFIGFLFLCGIAATTPSSGSAHSTSDEAKVADTSSRPDDAKKAPFEERRASAERAEDAHLIHGDPDCLTIDYRTLGTESADSVGYIKGKLHNGCDKDFSYVQIEINFLSGDSVTGSTMVNVNNLSANQTWNWKNPVFGSDEEGKTWKVTKISGF